MGRGKSPAGGEVALGVTDTDDALGEVRAGSAVAVIFPDVTARRWLMLSSTPVTRLSAPTCTAVPTDATVSHSAAVAPPCKMPYGWTLPSTGMVATTRSSEISIHSIPSRSANPARMCSLARRAASAGGSPASGASLSADPMAREA